MIETRPVHEQLLAMCQQELAAGRWRAGDRFPSERELAKRHGISRATANKVVAKLASEGWLELRKGLGTYVAERPTLFASLRRMESFTEFARQQGFDPSTEVTTFERGAEIPPELARSVGRSIEGLVIHVRRIRKVDGEAVILEDRWLPAGRYPRLTRKALEGSFYELCRERYGFAVAREEAEIRAVVAPKTASLDWKGPVLRLIGTGFDRTGDAVWHQCLYYRGDRFSLLNSVDGTAVPH